MSGRSISKIPRTGLNETRIKIPENFCPGTYQFCFISNKLQS
ncbi:Uncharacterized protein dnm_024890 [Desulfonema magnum]|uniref:Uncharacterized protein n=1 Tax=Desulfonema magnum TaxID=45655 RepID=A0A975BJI0_9BACT|nr:Uncharacterized protein dnm_024890 [Desulfonema magnum]